jgi:hypothetical protein
LNFAHFLNIIFCSSFHFNKSTVYSLFQAHTYIFAIYILYSSKVLTSRSYYIRVVIMEQQTAARNNNDERCPLASIGNCSPGNNTNHPQARPNLSSPLRRRAHFIPVQHLKSVKGPIICEVREKKTWKVNSMMCRDGSSTLLHSVLLLHEFQHEWNVQLEGTRRRRTGARVTANKEWNFSFLLDLCSVGNKALCTADQTIRRSDTLYSHRATTTRANSYDDNNSLHSND